MSWFDYAESLRISKEDPPFYAIIIAAFRKADTQNLAKLKFEWPEVYEEFKARYDAPGGFLPEEEGLRKLTEGRGGG